MPGVVTIGCKLPSGIHLCIFAMEPAFEPVLGGGMRETKRAVPVGRVTIRGTGRASDDPRVVGGYALTPNVDADVWAKWLADNKDADLVKKGLIFAHAKHDSAEAIAREHKNERSGLEPVDPTNLPTEFKNKIETAKAA